MFCPKCGKEVVEDIKFCSNCGTQIGEDSLLKNDVKADLRNNKFKKKRKKWIIAIPVVIILFIVLLVNTSSESEDIESYISIVKNGYLGEYTDTTTGDFLDGWYGYIYDETKWNGGITDNGEIIVEFQAEMREDGNYYKSTCIQFKLYDEQVFRVSGYDDGSGKKFESTELAAELNYNYFWYLCRDKEYSDEIIQEVLERFDGIAGTSVLYGASAEYSGNRSKLGKEFYNESPIDLNARELINCYYDDFLEYDNLFSGIFGEGEEYWVDENTQTDKNIETDRSVGYLLQYSDSQYLSEADLQGFTAEECRIARNEIYARHGRIFQDESLQSYFEQFEWYSSKYDSENFDESMLNEYEIANRDLIIEYESKMGYR